MKLVFYSIAIIFALLIIFQYGNAYATHLTEKSTWQLIYVTHNNSCSNYDYQIFNKYAELTEKYFELYQFNNTKYSSSCLTLESFNSYESPVELDLLLVVYDRELGEAELHSKNLGGAYLHDGSDKRQNHVIVMCDCANFYYSDPVWILSHELSHFILFVLNFDTSIIENLVHVYDKQYDSCMKDYTEQCTNVIYKLRIDSMAYSISIMPPYKNAIGIEKLETPTEISPNVISLNKVITKWWKEGKITDAEYANAIGHMVSDQEYFDTVNSKVMFADEPINGNEKTWKDILNPKKENDDLFSTIPFASESSLNKPHDGSNTLPNWFEDNAKLWAEDKITTEDFVRNVKYLREQRVTQPQLENVPDSNLPEMDGQNQNLPRLTYNLVLKE